MAKLGTLSAAAVALAADLNSGMAAWTPSSPTYSGLTIGNGTVVSKYAFAGRTYTFKWKLTLGSSSSVTGWPNISVPQQAADNLEVGSCVLFDTSGSVSKLGSVIFASATAIGPVYPDTAAATPTMTFVSATLPFTWAVGDTIQMSITYEGTA